MASKVISDAQIEKERTSFMMKVIAKRVEYYRKNLDKFCYDYLGITNLKWFQKILLWINEKDYLLANSCRWVEDIHASSTRRHYYATENHKVKKLLNKYKQQTTVTVKPESNE